MAIRTTANAVRKVIDTDTNIEVSPFTDAASELVDYVETQDSDGVLTSGLLRQIETYLAAHLYALRDGQYLEKKTGDASAVFEGKTGMYLEFTRWGQMAITLDISGTLRKLSGGVKKVSLTWLGLPPSEQTDYVDRD